MSARDARGTGRPDSKMSRSDDEVKQARFGKGSAAHRRVQDMANVKRRQRDRSATQQDGH